LDEQSRAVTGQRRIRAAREFTQQFCAYIYYIYGLFTEIYTRYAQRYCITAQYCCYFAQRRSGRGGVMSSAARKNISITTAVWNELIEEKTRTCLKTLARRAPPHAATSERNPLHTQHHHTHTTKLAPPHPHHKPGSGCQPTAVGPIITRTTPSWGDLRSPCAEQSVSGRNSETVVRIRVLANTT
jgi:hypothetical protein